MQVFESLNDLDDARDLGRSCRHFSQLHVTYKRKIARSIIVSVETINIHFLKTYPCTLTVEGIE